MKKEEIKKAWEALDDPLTMSAPIVLKSIQNQIDWCKENIQEFKENEISDGYHTFNELYEFRKMYNAALFNEWAKGWFTLQSGLDSDNHEIRNAALTTKPKYDVHKSIRHHDGEDCFGGGWFIVVAVLPTGQISNHYKLDDWDLFNIPEEEKAKYPFDGHSPQDVLIRIRQIL
ncbi:MAG: hypothetical protein AB3N18_04555 [Allomuricauda sp.]